MKLSDLPPKTGLEIPIRRTSSSGRRAWEHPQYTCSSRGCPTGNTSIRLADPIIDAALSALLGTAEVLERLVAESLRAAQDRAKAAPAEVTRKLTDLANQRRRLIDAHVAGVVDLRETERRAAAIDSEIATLERLAARADDSIEIDDEVLDALVDVFSS